MNAPRGRLGAYAWWQLRDYMLGPGALTVLVALMILVPLFVSKNVAVREGVNPADMQRVFTRGFDTLLAIIATLGPILGIANFASADRHPGLARFLFAKPVRTRGYYLQTWVVRGLAFGAITLVIVLAVNQFIVPVSAIDALAAVGMAWLLIAGAGFLISVLIPRDGVVVLLMFMLPTMLAALVENGAKWWWLKPTLSIMPPVHKLDEFRHAVLGAGDVVRADAWHMALFGVVCVALAAYLVRRLPLVR